jgi:hypothetical protein
MGLAFPLAEMLSSFVLLLVGTFLNKRKAPPELKDETEELEKWPLALEVFTAVCILATEVAFFLSWFWAKELYWNFFLPQFVENFLRDLIEAYVGQRFFI